MPERVTCRPLLNPGKILVTGKMSCSGISESRVFSRDGRYACPFHVSSLLDGRGGVSFQDCSYDSTMVCEFTRVRDGDVMIIRTVPSGSQLAGFIC